MMNPCHFEDARLRPIRLRTIRLRPAGRNQIGRSRNWPKSKLAEVEINWPKSNKWCLLCFFFLSFFFFIYFVFSLFFTFFFFLLISLFILFWFCVCFRPKKPELNSKPRTLHPIADGPAGQPSAGQPSAGQPSAGPPPFPWTALPLDRPSAEPPKISLFFIPPPATIFILLSLSWCPSVEFCWCF